MPVEPSNSIQKSFGMYMSIALKRSPKRVLNPFGSIFLKNFISSNVIVSSCLNRGMPLFAFPPNVFNMPSTNFVWRQIKRGLVVARQFDKTIFLLLQIGHPV